MTVNLINCLTKISISLASRDGIDVKNKRYDMELAAPSSVFDSVEAAPLKTGFGSVGGEPSKNLRNQIQLIKYKYERREVDDSIDMGTTILLAIFDMEVDGEGEMLTMDAEDARVGMAEEEDGLRSSISLADEPPASFIDEKGEKGMAPMVILPR